MFRSIFFATFYILRQDMTAITPDSKCCCRLQRVSFILPSISYTFYGTGHECFYEEGGVLSF